MNERALDLVRRNADALGLANVNAVLPDDVPDDVTFRTIRSNPPIRVGKHELHGLLERWIPRLDERSDAWLVVQRNLGSDSLQRWLAASFEPGYSVHRAATGRGFRVLKVRRHGVAARRTRSRCPDAPSSSASGERDLARVHERRRARTAGRAGRRRTREHPHAQRAARHLDASSGREPPDPPSAAPRAPRRRHPCRS